MSLRLIEPAQTLPVTLAEAKAHLRVTSTDEDALITSMIAAATEVAEQETGRAIMEQVWELTQNSFTGIVLTRPPIISVDSITYVDATGITKTLPTSAYKVRSDDYGFATVEPVYGADWPGTLDDTDVVTVTYTAGYEYGVPQGIKSWILLQVSAMYENREAEAYSSRAVSTTVKMSFVDGLLDRYRVHG